MQKKKWRCFYFTKVISLLLFLLLPAAPGTTLLFAEGPVDVPNVEAGGVELPCINWVVSEDDESVNKRQAERIYESACKWLDNEFGRRVNRPCFTVYVGRSCKDPRIKGACVNLLERAVFLPEWGPSSAGYIFQATVYAALLDLFEPAELIEKANEVIREDALGFVDYFGSPNSPMGKALREKANQKPPQ